MRSPHTRLRFRGRRGPGQVREGLWRWSASCFGYLSVRASVRCALHCHRHRHREGGRLTPRSSAHPKAASCARRKTTSLGARSRCMRRAVMTRPRPSGAGRAGDSGGIALPARRRPRLDATRVDVRLAADRRRCSLARRPSPSARCARHIAALRISSPNGAGAPRRRTIPLPGRFASIREREDTLGRRTFDSDSVSSCSAADRYQVVEPF